MILVKKEIGTKIALKIVPKRYHEKAVESIEKFHSATNEIANKKTLLTCFCITAAIWLSEVLRIYFLVLAVGKNLDIPSLLLAFCLVVVVSAIPISPGGTGVVESVETLALIIVGLEKNIAVIVTLLDRIINFWIMNIIGGIIAIIMGREIYESSKKSEKS